MADTEQEGVSPATAGGASVPEPFRRMFWIAAEDIANRIGCTVVEGKPRGYGVPAEGSDAELRKLANRLHAIVGEEGCRVASIDVGHLHKMIDLVEGHLDEISRRNRADTQRAEIVRLRETVEEQRVRIGNLARHADAMTQQSDEADRERDEALAEIERLRGKLAEAEELETQRDQANEYVQSVEADLERANDQAIKATNERNEAREEWKRADAEVTRLRDQVDELAGVRVALFGEVRSALTERDLFRDAVASIKGAIGQVERLAAAMPVGVVSSDG